MVRNLYMIKTKPEIIEIRLVQLIYHNLIIPAVGSEHTVCRPLQNFIQANNTALFIVTKSSFLTVVHR